MHLTVHTYKTESGKDLIRTYVDTLPINESVDGTSVIEALEDGRLDELKINHWQGKIYEIYFYRHNRIFYVAIEDTDIYLLHACKKQKNKTEKKDAQIIIKRAKELGKQLSKKLI